MRTTMRKIGIRAVAALLAFGGGVVITGGTLVAGATPASAACSWFYEDRDPGSEKVIHPVSGFSGIAMRTGIYQSCDLVTRVPWGHWVVLDCFANGGDTVHGVSKWSHVKYSSGGPLRQGWINNYYLSNGGSHVNCTS